MKTILGFEKLLKVRPDLPDYGWIYIDKHFDTESPSDIINGQYYISENDEDEMLLEGNYSTFLEAPIFNAVVENKLVNTPNSGSDELIDAIIYYLENDDFQD